MQFTAEQVRRARWAVSVMFCVDGAALGGLAPHFASIKQTFHLSSGSLGTLLLASSCGAILTMPFTGFAIHRFGSRVTGIAGGLLLCVALSLLLLAPSIALTGLLLFLVGVFNGQLDVGMNAHSLAVQERCERPILSAVHGWFSVGGFLGGASASLAASMVIADSSHLALTCGLLAIVLVVVSRWLLPATVDSNAEGVRFALPVGPLALLGVLAVCAFVSEGAVWDWTAVYLRTVLRSDAAIGALGFGLFSFGMAIARFVGDGFVHSAGPKVVITVSAAVACLGIGLALLASNPWPAIAGFTLVGLGIANIIPIIYRAAGSVPGFTPSVGLAAVTTCGYGGFLLGPPLIGVVAQTRSLDFALGGVGCLFLVIAIMGPRVIGRQSSERI